MLPLPPATPLLLRAVGFCGIDDSVDVDGLLAISARAPWVEWGILFRPDTAGTPRYASSEWLTSLSVANAASADGDRPLRLAGHLCGDRVVELLRGDADFVTSTHAALGVRRFQINATAVNGVDPSLVNAAAAALLRATVAACPAVEFIMQRNEETRALWEPFLSETPPNVSFLFDESKGRGTLSASYPCPPNGTLVGFAGGLGPANLGAQLAAMRVAVAPRGEAIWVDMESSLREIVVSSDAGGGDIFSLARCEACVATVEAMVAVVHVARACVCRVVSVCDVCVPA